MPVKQFSLQGMGVSKGGFKGTAQVVLGYKGIKPALKGKVLICHETNPQWQEAFELAGAVITEVGSLLCHAAIVCREEGLPCIVNVDNATDLIKTGDTVALDGKTGTIMVYREEEEDDGTDE